MDPFSHDTNTYRAYVPRGRLPFKFKLLFDPQTQDSLVHSSLIAITTGSETEADDDGDWTDESFRRCTIIHLFPVLEI